MSKSNFVTVRLDPATAGGLEEMAKKEGRKLGAMASIIFEDYFSCKLPRRVWSEEQGWHYPPSDKK